MGNFLLSQSVPEQSDTLRHLFGWASGRSHQDYVNSLLMMLSWARIRTLTIWAHCPESAAWRQHPETSALTSGMSSVVDGRNHISPGALGSQEV